MANYIKTLQAENEALKNNIKEQDQKLTDMLVYLSSSKFTSSMENNFVNAQEMYSKINELRSALLLA